MAERETELFQPVKSYLENLGFRVDGEVGYCDIVATGYNKNIILELKNSFSMHLVYQLIDRQETGLPVYAVIANRTGKTYPGNIRKIKKLLKRLNAGLLIVHFRRSGTVVEPALEPAFAGKGSSRKKNMILRELDGRYKNFNTGGSVSSESRITAYRLDSIHTAVILKDLGSGSPASVKKKGGPLKAGRILSDNYYGWFRRIRRGEYTLTDKGNRVSEDYPEQFSYFKKNLQNIKENC